MTDNFWLCRLLHPGVSVYQMKIVSYEVRGKNVDGSAEGGFKLEKNLGIIEATTLPRKQKLKEVK